MPSKRPQTMSAPGPHASASTRACVNGAPRGLMSRRGRLSSGASAASIARASTSAFITMPGPPPAGVSSTVRWRSVAWVRMSCASSRQMPVASALPARLCPSGPGNISGKMGRTVACHMVSVLVACAASVLEHTGGRIDHDAAALDVDHRHGRAGEWQHDGLAFAFLSQLENVAGAEIVDCHDRAELAAVRCDRRKPDQVGVIELVRRRCRQALARHEELYIGEALG